MTALLLVKSLSELQVRSIESVRKAGFRVFVRHKRYYFVKDFPGPSPVVHGAFTRKEATVMGYDWKNLSSKGGYTDVEIHHSNELVTRGGANCSMKDPYVKKIGRQIAFGRAMANLTRQSSTI